MNRPRRISVQKHLLPVAPFSSLYQHNIISASFPSFHNWISGQPSSHYHEGARQKGDATLLPLAFASSMTFPLSPPVAPYLQCRRYLNNSFGIDMKALLNCKMNGQIFCYRIDSSFKHDFFPVGGNASCSYSTTAKNCATHESHSKIINNKPTESENIGQLFREIASRAEFADRTSSRGGKTVGTEVGQDLCNRKSASSLTSAFCKKYLSLPNKSLSLWKSSKPVGDNSTAEYSKEQFLEVLLDDAYGTNETSILSALDNIKSHTTASSDNVNPLAKKIIPTAVCRLRELCTPRYERVFFYILGSAQQDLGVAFLVKLRKDVRESIHYSKFVQGKEMQDEEKDENQQHEILFAHQHLPKLQQLEKDIQAILTSLFRPGVLQLQQITYHNTPASIIEQIAFKEAVHPLQSLQDLRTRLGPGRRCFAFFHPSLPNKPLVFVHVALLQNVPTSMGDIQVGTQCILDGNHSESNATCAAFYSITNTEPGLAGVDLGNHLIKSVVQVLKEEFPDLETFCTLSPIPNFKKWLEEKIVRYHKETLRVEQQMISHDFNEDKSRESLIPGFKFMDNCLFSQQEMDQLEDLFPSALTPPLLSLLQTLQDPNWHTSQTNSSSFASSNLSHQLQPLLLKLAAYYLTIERHRGRPLCPVAKFHIRNGAEMYRLNYMADTSTKGMRNSCGIMINYRYLLDQIEENHVRYEMSGEVAVRDGVTSWLR